MIKENRSKFPKLKNISQWKAEGYRPKRGEEPQATEWKHFYRIGDVLVKYFSRNQVVSIKKRAEVTFDGPITLEIVLEALWTINKNVKNRRNRKQDYQLKDKVLAKLKPLAERVEVHYAAHPGRNYLRRRHYLDEEGDCDETAYWSGCAKAERDERERPYFSNGTVYDVYQCYYFSGGYTFHVPVVFHTKTKPDNATLLADGCAFFSPRRQVQKVTVARLILNKFLSSSCTDTAPVEVRSE